MKELNVEKNCAFIITDYVTRKYFSEIDIAEGYLIIASSAFYLTDSRYFLGLKEKLESKNITPLLFNSLNDINLILKKLNIETIFLDYDKITVTTFNSFKELGFEIKDASLIIKEKRMIKSKEEIEKIKKACDIAQKSYYEGIKFLKIGITEKEIKDRIVGSMISLGASGESFETIVAFGKNSALPHHQTGCTKLSENMPVLIDMGCIVDGYMSDLTRTCFFGKPDKEFIDNYNQVLAANIKAENEICNGMCVKDADKIARNYFASYNLDRFFTHSLGHCLGTEIHEYPFLSPKGQGILENNMVFSVEPGLYFDYKYGIRIEDTVMIENGKVIRFFTDSKKLNIIKIK